MKDKTLKKALVVLYVLFCLLLALCSWAYWNELHLALKVLIVMLEAFLMADLQAVKSVFRPTRD